MPYYTYYCPNCEYRVERYLKINDRDSMVGSVCSSCGKEGMIRPMEAPGFTTSESLGRVKAPREFRDFLSAVKKANPGSTINER